MQILQKIFLTIKNNKYLILLGICLTFIFSIILLPKPEINTYINSQISAYTQGQVQFKSKSFSISPLLAMNFSKNLISYKKLEIAVKEIFIKPLWLDSLLLNFGIEINAHSIFGGDANLILKQNKNKKHPLTFNLTLQNTSLEVLPLKSIKLNGKISAALNLLIDPQLFNSPNIKLQVLSQSKIQVLHSQLPSPFGPIQIPSINFSQIKTNITTTGETLNINNLELGSNKDPLQIKITGTARLKIKKEKRKKNLSLQSYNLAIYIKSQKIPQELSSLFSLINNYKVGNVYQFHLKGSSLFSIPEITK